MSDDQKKQLEQQLWNIANTLRGKINPVTEQIEENKAYRKGLLQKMFV